MKRLLATAASSLVAMGWPAQPLDAQEDPAAAAAQAAADPDAARRRAWWNDPKIAEGLSLSEEQRQSMDRHLESYREALSQQGREALALFHEALGDADWERARAQLEKLVAEAAVPFRARGELKIAVLSVLSDEQRSTLEERFPRLIARPWVRPGRPTRPRAGPGR